MKLQASWINISHGSIIHNSVKFRKVCTWLVLRQLQLTRQPPRESYENLLRGSWNVLKMEEAYCWTGLQLFIRHESTDLKPRENDKFYSINILNFLWQKIYWWWQWYLRLESVTLFTSYLQVKQWIVKNTVSYWINEDKNQIKNLKTCDFGLT